MKKRMICIMVVLCLVISMSSVAFAKTSDVQSVQEMGELTAAQSEDLPEIEPKLNIEGATEIENHSPQVDTYMTDDELVVVKYDIPELESVLSTEGREDNTLYTADVDVNVEILEYDLTPELEQSIIENDYALSPAIEPRLVNTAQDTKGFGNITTTLRVTFYWNTYYSGNNSYQCLRLASASGSTTQKAGEGMVFQRGELIWNCAGKRWINGVQERNGTWGSTMGVGTSFTKTLMSSGMYVGPLTSAGAVVGWDSYYTRGITLRTSIRW